MISWQFQLPILYYLPGFWVGSRYSLVPEDCQFFKSTFSTGLPDWLLTDWWLQWLHHHYCCSVKSHLTLRSHELQYAKLPVLHHSQSLLKLMPIVRDTIISSSAVLFFLSSIFPASKLLSNSQKHWVNALEPVTQSFQPFRADFLRLWSHFIYRAFKELLDQKHCSF